MSTAAPARTSNSELLGKIDILIREEKHLEAARLIRTIQDPSILKDSHRKLLTKARFIEETVKDLLSNPRDEWIKQGESHGRYDFTIYYKVEDGARLTCRIESPVPSSLLVPLLSVLNESALYRTWIPSWQVPFKLGVQESNQILHDSRGHQVIQVHVSIPWPMKPREALFSVQAVDDIDRNGFIIAKMTTLEDSTEKGSAFYNSLPETFEVPSVGVGMERCDFDGAVLFRACPKDHPNFLATAEKFPGQDLILLQFTCHFDAKMTMVPQSMINFVTRTALGVVWNMLLKVAEQVKDGSREEHCKVIAEKPDFYKWVEDRCRYMLHRMNDTTCTSEDPSKTKDSDRTTPNKQSTRKENNNHWTLQEVLRMNM